MRQYIESTEQSVTTWEAHSWMVLIPWEQLSSLLGEMKVSVFVLVGWLGGGIGKGEEGRGQNKQGPRALGSPTWASSDSPGPARPFSSPARRSGN